MKYREAVCTEPKKGPISASTLKISRTGTLVNLATRKKIRVANVSFSLSRVTVSGKRVNGKTVVALNNMSCDFRATSTNLGGVFEGGVFLETCR